MLTPHPFLVPWSWKSRAKPLLPLWTVRPVQSLSACTRVHFTLPFMHIHGARVRWNCLCVSTNVYSRITTIKFPSFCLTTFSASLTNVTVFLLEPHDCSCYLSRRILAPLQIWMQKHTDLCAHDFAHSPYLWYQPTNVSCAWRWTLCGNNPAIVYVPFLGLTLHLPYVWVETDVSNSPQIFLEDQMVLLEKKNRSYCGS